MENYEETFESDESNHSSCINNESRNIIGEQAKAKDGDLGDFVSAHLGLAHQCPQKVEQLIMSRPATSRKTETLRKKSKENCNQCAQSSVPYCHVDLNSMLKLKESTKKLLSVLEEIQWKTRGKYIKTDDTDDINKLLNINSPTQNPSSVTDLVNTNALNKLEYQAKVLDSIYIQDEDDDCSVYKRLTRKCYCLNHLEYNDFVIHFNEDTKYRTSIAGEVIKNMRIVKKFLYMNGKYTKNALLFINEGLAESTHTEKVEIIQGCAHADICNVFDDNSIVVIYIAWPCKYEHYGDTVTQALTASFLYKLALLEEGRRYLNYSSKIVNELKKVLRKKSTVLEFETLEILNATLNLLNPPLTQNMNITYYYKPIDEGVGKKTLFALIDYRQYMTLQEVFAHLELIHDLSARETCKLELISSLPLLFTLFKRILVEYDNSEINILLTKILSNILTKNVVKENEELEESKALTIADIGTEPILMKNEMIQYPPRKSNGRKLNKSKLGLGVGLTKHNILKQRDHPLNNTSREDQSRLINRSRKFNNDKHRSSVIFVPMQK